MNRPASEEVRLRVAWFIVALFLGFLLAALAGGCQAPTRPSAAPSAVRVVTVSGPALPAILALPEQITLGTGLPAVYIGRTGGSKEFAVGTVPEEYCSWSYGTLEHSYHIFRSEEGMENLDPWGRCNELGNSALHELGHGLGLVHPAPPCGENVMCVEGSRRSERSWGPGDLEALGRIYR